MESTDPEQEPDSNYVDTYRYGVNPVSIEEAQMHFIRLAREMLWKQDNIIEDIRNAPNIEMVRQIMIRHKMVHEQLWWISHALMQIASPAVPFPLQIMTGPNDTGEQVYMVVYPEEGIGHRW